jgi:hypothetical protein
MLTEPHEPPREPSIKDGGLLGHDIPEFLIAGSNLFDASNVWPYLSVRILALLYLLLFRLQILINICITLGCLAPPDPN